MLCKSRCNLSALAKAWVICLLALDMAVSSIPCMQQSNVVPKYVGPQDTGPLASGNIVLSRRCPKKLADMSSKLSSIGIEQQADSAE